MLFKYNGNNGNDTRLDVDVWSIYGLTSCWLLTNRQYVIIGAYMNLNASLLGFMHDDTIATAYSPAIQIPYNGDDIWHFGDVEYGIVLALNEQHVCWYRFMCEFACIITWFHARWHHRDCILTWYSNIMAITYGFALILILTPSDTIAIAYLPAMQIPYNGDGIYGTALMSVEYMKRFCVGLDWTGSTLLLVHVWIWMCHCLIYDTRCDMKAS